MADEAAPPYESLQLIFTYRHAYGALQPFFDGLRQGVAVGTRCPVCGRRWYPPRMTCRYHGVPAEGVEFSGRGEIIALTSGPTKLPLADRVCETTWALVRLGEAENAIVARILADGRVAEPGAGVMLVPPTGPAPHPAQHAVFTLIAEGR